MIWKCSTDPLPRLDMLVYIPTWPVSRRPLQGVPSSEWKFGTVLRHTIPFREVHPSCRVGTRGNLGEQVCGISVLIRTFLGNHLS